MKEAVDVLNTGKQSFSVEESTSPFGKGILAMFRRYVSLVVLHSTEYFTFTAQREICLSVTLKCIHVCKSANSTTVAAKQASKLILAFDLPWYVLRRYPTLLDTLRTAPCWTSTRFPEVLYQRKGGCGITPAVLDTGRKAWISAAHSMACNQFG